MSIHRTFRISFLILGLSLLVWAWCPLTASAVGFRPVSPEELKMTSEPGAPGAPAIILYRQVDRDDSGRTAHEDDYFRIKILTEEGRKYGDVEIPYDKALEDITSIHARTIKPDGSIADFDGKVFTKSVAKAKGLKYLAKTFTLPAVTPGCIIEYYYTDDLSEDWIIDSHWILSNELFTKAGDFSLKPFISDNVAYTVRWTWQNTPPGAPPATAGPDHVVHLHVSNVAPFLTEDLMPPENELKWRVDFNYSLDAPESDVNHFWSKVGKRMNSQMESFVGKPKALDSAVAEIVGLNDSPEVKLQKIYARVQELRNTSYEVRKTDEETKREKEKAPATAEEVWKRGYGSGFDLTWLYLALVRAAGFEAYGIKAADRGNYFFNPSLMQSGRVNANLVLVKLNGKNIYCDPGAAFTPFGLLPWQETGIQGLQLDKKDPTWVHTLSPTSDQARTERHANLTLTDTGDLEGKLTVTYTGVEAARLRREERHADDTERKKYLEDIVKGYVSAASEVKLTNQPDWKNPALPLVAELDLKVPGWASGAGRHFLVPVGLFGAHEKHLFDPSERVHPIYFEYPYAEQDDIDIQLPAGWKISSIPQGWKSPEKALGYTLTAQDNNGKLHLSRTLTVDMIFLDVQYYSLLRHIFQEIKTNDDQQVVLDPAAARAGN